MPEILEYASPAPPPQVTTAVRIRAALMLVLCCLFWGWSFPTMQMISPVFDSYTHPESMLDVLATRALFIALRFGFAALIFGAITLQYQRRFSRADVLGGITVGLSFAIGGLLQVVALNWTLPSVSAFLTALTVVFTPLFQAAVTRRRVSGLVWLAVAVAFAGVVLLSLPNPAATSTQTLVTKPPLPLLGEILTVLGSLLFTVQILCLDRYGQDANPLRLSFIMFVTTTVLALAIATSSARVFQPQVLTGIATDRTVWWIMASLVLFSSIGAMHLMNTYQPRVSPAAASIIYCTEPVFALFFSLGFGTESLTLLSLAGGAAVVAAVLIVVKKP